VFEKITIEVEGLLRGTVYEKFGYILKEHILYQIF